MNDKRKQPQVRVSTVRSGAERKLRHAMSGLPHLADPTGERRMGTLREPAETDRFINTQGEGAVDMASNKIELEILAAMQIDPQTVKYGSVSMRPLAGGVLVTWEGQHWVDRELMAAILGEEKVEGDEDSPAGTSSESEPRAGQPARAVSPDSHA